MFGNIIFRLLFTVKENVFFSLYDQYPAFHIPGAKEQYTAQKNLFSFHAQPSAACHQKEDHNHHAQPAGN